VLQQIKQELAIENVRNQISSQLHDDIGSTLSGVLMYSHLANNMLDKGEQRNAQESLNVIQRSASEIVEKLDDLVWSVNPNQDTLELLLERVENFALEMCHAKNIQLKINIAEQINGINFLTEHRHNIYLFLKEAINNAVKYSGAAIIEISIRQLNDMLMFLISDDGKGFEHDTVKKGNGLKNMQKRAAEIGAEFVLQTIIEKGTKVSLNIKSPNGVL